MMYDSDVPEKNYFDFLSLAASWRYMSLQNSHLILFILVCKS
jgi:hypothetical protein